MDAREEREVSIFRNGRSRAVRIPAEFDIPADSMMISQDRDGVIYMRPKLEKKSLAEVFDWLAEQDPLDITDVEDYPPEPVNLEK